MIILAHLLNDRSGSPRVLKAVIESFTGNEEPVLYIGSHGEGVLSTVRIPTRKYWYRRYRSRVLTLLSYFASQGFLFWALLSAKGIPKDAVVYANTLLPISPEKSIVVYNTVDVDLAYRAAKHEYAHRRDGQFVVLLLASNRDYKGMPEFLSLAQSMAGRADIGFRF